MRPASLRASLPVNPKALSKDPLTGLVTVNEDRCVGCGECVTACPYGAMGYDAIGHHAVKCDLCVSRREREPGTTACASVCPTKAISFGVRDELLEESAQQGRRTYDQDTFALEPATVYLRGHERDGLNAPDSLLSTVPAVVDAPPMEGALTSQYPYRAAPEERSIDRVEPGGCNICFNCCTTKFHFHGDRLVKITGNPEDPVLEGRVCRSPR